MVSSDDARTVVGIVGNVVSFGLFVSPVPTFLKMYKSKSVQGFSPNPYLATVLNCSMWMFYGLPFVKPDSTLVVTVNSAGLLIELTYVAVYFFYADWPKRRKIIITLLVEFLFLTTMVALTMTLLHTPKKRATLVGIVCIIFNIGMYASPLTIMGDVIKTKSVKYFPVCLSLANFVNGSIWMVYAILKIDANILVPNCLGAIFGAIQLLLYATYYRTTKWDEDEEEINPNKPAVIIP